MKKLIIYKENNEFVLERVNQFNHSTKRFFISKEGLFEALGAYGANLEDYELEVKNGELWGEITQSFKGKRP